MTTRATQKRMGIRLESDLLSKVGFWRRVSAAATQKNGCSGFEHPLQLFSLVGSRRLELRNLSTFSSFSWLPFSSWPLIASLKVWGPIPTRIIFLMPRTRSHSEYCGSEFAMSTEKCIFRYDDRQENIMYKHERLGLIRGIGYAIAVAIMILATVWRLVPHSH